MANILVLITCYNRKEKTLKFIDTVLQDEQQNFSFLIVDDNSNDGTAEAVSVFPNVKVIKGNGNLFYSGGMRTAIDEAKASDIRKYDFVMLANDDVEFYKGAITKLISYLGAEKSIIVGATCSSDGEMSYSGVVRTGKIRPGYRNVMSVDDEKRYCDTFCANCVLMPTDIFSSLDNIDPVYHHAMGDFDYGYQAGKKGIRILASHFFVGVCNDNSKVGTWKDVSLSRRERIRKKESPKGLPGKEWFHYLRKNCSFLTAVFYSIVPYVQIILGK
ncbi:MAG: glycosyltransferase family 2 protein [Lachnospiraceae bacterium]|nr:glycosyltransferase family 2 protein [Lachnospiraceae bacterium]